MHMRFHANPLTARRGAAHRRARSTARGSRRSVTGAVWVYSLCLYIVAYVFFDTEKKTNGSGNTNISIELISFNSSSGNTSLYFASLACSLEQY